MDDKTIKDLRRLPSRFQPHYCRECGEIFPHINTNATSPHAQVWMHMFTRHREIYLQDYVSCSRHCVNRAQNEELKSGIRMYGKDIVPFLKSPLRAQYEDVFPEEL